MAESIGRLFVEILADSSKLAKGIDDAVKALGEVDAKTKSFGERLAKNLDNALNPTVRLEKAFTAMGQVGRSASDIVQKYGDQILKATEVARQHDKPISDMMLNYERLAKSMQASGFSLESLGRNMTAFASGPVEATKAGLVAILEKMGPVAVGIGALGTAVVTAGYGLGKLAENLADNAVSLRNQAMAAGITAQEFQALNRIGVETGVNTDSLARMMGMLNRELATGTKMDFVKVLNALRESAGEGAADISHGVIPVLDDLGKRLAAIEDPGRRAELINAAFNRRLQELGVLVVLTKGHLHDYIQEVINAGAVYGGETQERLLRMKEQLNELGRSYEASKVKAVGFFTVLADYYSRVPMSMTGPEYWRQQPEEPKPPKPEEFVGPPVPAPSADVIAKQKYGLEIAKMIHDQVKESKDMMVVLFEQMPKLAEYEQEYEKAVNAGAVADAKRWAQKVADLKTFLDLLKEYPKVVKQTEEDLRAIEKIGAFNYQKPGPNIVLPGLGVTIPGNIINMGVPEGQMNVAGHAALVPSQAELTALVKPYTELIKKAGEEANQVTLSVGRAVTQSKVEELRIQQQIVASVIPMNEFEREQIELTKVHGDIALRIDETRLKFAQLRAELEAKIEKYMGVSPGLAQKATEELGQLDARLKAELGALMNLESAELLKVHRQEYLRMIDTVRDGAGKVFDAITARGKGAFTSLADWIEGIFLSRLRQLFQNLVQMIFTPSGTNQSMMAQLFQGVFPKFLSAATSTAATTAAAVVYSNPAVQAASAWQGVPYPYAGEAGGGFGGIGIPGFYEMGAGFGGGGVAGAAGKASMFGGFSSSLAGPVGIMGAGAGLLGSNNAWMKGAGGALIGLGGTTAAMMTGLGIAGAGTLSFMPALMAAGPIAAAIAAAIFGGIAMAKAFQGKNAYQAGGMEALRDFGVSFSTDQMKQFLTSKNITEEQAYPIRKDIESSPQFLTQLGAMAKQQGTYDQFLSRLEKVNTAWGTFNFRAAYEIGDVTGDWTALDKAFTDAFSSSKALEKNLPNWRDILTISGDAAKKAAAEFESLWQTFQDTGEMTDEFTTFLQQNAAALDTVALKSSVVADQLDSARLSMAKFIELKPAIDGFKSLQSAIEGLVNTSANNIYQSFLETGVITDELAGKITDFGGDLSKFEDLAGLVKINNQFEDLVQHFKDTGEILPELRQLFIDFGGDLAVLDSVAGLPNLMKGLDGINSLISGLNSLTKTPIQQVLAGEWGADTWGGLSSMNLDPSKLTGVTDLIAFEKGWDQSLNDFYNKTKPVWDPDQKKYVQTPVGLEKGGILEQALYQFGGAEGIQAIQNYAKGFNTITPALLASTKAAMDTAYQKSIKDALDYLGVQQKDTKDKIGTMTTAVTSEFDTVGQNIGTAISNAALDVIAELKLILAAINKTVVDAGAGAAASTIPYYNAQGSKYSNESASYWQTGGQWYMGETGGKISPIDQPPWLEDQPVDGGKKGGGNKYDRGMDIAGSGEPAIVTVAPVVYINGPVYAEDMPRTIEAGFQAMWDRGGYQRLRHAITTGRI